MPPELSEIDLGSSGPQGLVTFIIIAGFTLLVALIAGLVLRRWVRSFVRRTETSLDDLALDVLGKPVVIAILVAGLQVALRTSGILILVSPQLLGTAFYFAYWLLFFVTLYRLLNVVEKWCVSDIQPRVSLLVRAGGP